MKSKKRRRNFGPLVFFIPVVLIVAVIAYAVISGIASQTGTLMVRAETSSRYYSALPLNATVRVSGTNGFTPINLTLTQGSYTVTFFAIQWFTTPPSKMVSVVTGANTYAIGVYNPLIRVVAITSSGFNTTRVTALRGFTPIVLVNHLSGYAVLDSNATGRILIPPAQNFTHVFSYAGTVSFSLVATASPLLSVVVS